MEEEEEEEDHCAPPSPASPFGSTRPDPASRRRSVGVGGRQKRGTAKGSGQHVLRKFAARSLGRCPLVVRLGAVSYTHLTLPTMAVV